MKQQQNNALSPAEQLLQWLNGMRIARALHVVATLGLADHLSTGPQSVIDLAAQTQTHEDSLYRLLRALATIGIFEEKEQRIFALTPISALLQTETPGSLHNMARMLGSDWQWHSWEGLIESIHTGQPYFQQIYQMDLWNYFSTLAPEEGRRFDAALSAAYNASNQAIAESYDFGQSDTLIDIGGGQGALLRTILVRFPHLHALLFDRPAVIEHARPQLAQLLPSLQLVAGDFFAEIPAGGDTYLLRQVLHDWPDEACLAILRNCRQAMRPDAHILVVERVLGPHSSAADTFLDLQHLVLLKGRERTTAEFEALYQQAGLYITNIICTSSPFSIINGRIL
jgi:hypothetical protein